MTRRYRAALSEAQALKLLELIASGSDLQIVSSGPLAVDLQLPNAPSPHAVNLEASYADGLLRLTFNMAEDELDRRLRWIEERARALDVSIVLA